MSFTPIITDKCYNDTLYSSHQWKRKAIELQEHIAHLINTLKQADLVCQNNLNLNQTIHILENQLKKQIKHVHLLEKINKQLNNSTKQKIEITWEQNSKLKNALYKATKALQQSQQKTSEYYHQIYRLKIQNQKLRGIGIPDDNTESFIYQNNQLKLQICRLNDLLDNLNLNNNFLERWAYQNRELSLQQQEIKENQFNNYTNKKIQQQIQHIISLTNQLNLKNMKLNQLNQMNYKLKNQLCNVKQKIDNIMNELNYYKQKSNQLECCMYENQSLKKQLYDLKSYYQACSKEKNQLKKQQWNRTNQISRLNQQLSNCKNQMQNIRKKQNQNSIFNKKQSNDFIGFDITKDLKQQVNTLKKNNLQIQAEKDFLKSQHFNCQFQIQRLKKKILMCQNQMKNSNKERDQIKMAHSNCSLQIQSLKNNIKKLNRDNKFEKQQINDLHQQEIRQLRIEIDNYQKKLSHLNQQKKKKKFESQNKQQQIQQLKSEILKLKKNNSNKLNQLDLKKFHQFNEYNQYNNQINKLHKIKQRNRFQTESHKDPTFKFKQKSNFLLQTYESK